MQGPVFRDKTNHSGRIIADGLISEPGVLKTEFFEPLKIDGGCSKFLFDLLNLPAARISAVPLHVSKFKISSF